MSKSAIVLADVFIFMVVIESMTIIFNSIPRLLRNHEYYSMPARNYLHLQWPIHAIEKEISKLQNPKLRVFNLKQV